jgi:hypothetical protein
MPSPRAMNPPLDHLLAEIRAHRLVRPEYYAGLDCDDALDQRNSRGPFDADWAVLYNVAGARWNEASLDVRDEVDNIRREAFLIVSTSTGQHEIASYVSDDLDLICRCRVLGIEHPLVEHLWLAYQSGTFPVPAKYAGQQSIGGR